MMLRTRRPRTAFTLVEILVVMGIIATLVGLLLPAVMRAGDAGKRAQASTEMNELGLAVGVFKSKYGVDHIPSKIKLCDTWSQYGNTQLDVDSQTFLKACWPNMGAVIDWNGNGVTNNDIATLEGDQCLVFFLGGINLNGQPIGFSTNPANPAYTGGNQRVGPFIQFQADRLADLKGNGYRSYIDPWKNKPYAYFSNYGKLNGYNRYAGPPLNLGSDCSLLAVSPYQSSATKYLNENGFQIITAGKDKAFGAGALALPASGPGEDDQANFSQTPLGNK